MATIASTFFRWIPETPLRGVVAVRGEVRRRSWLAALDMISGCNIVDFVLFIF